jgi:hypothetical protein
MSIPVELPASVEPRDRDLKYSARRFSGEFPQIEAAKHFAAIAGSALSFGVYGCRAGAMPTEFTAALASAGHAARDALKEAMRLIEAIEEIEREEIEKNVG